MKKTVSVLLISGFIFSFSSCKKKPEPCFTIDKNLNALFVNVPLGFSASCSIDANEFSWNFGDGTLATGQTATHTYINTGTYEVVLTATTTGRSESIARTIEIKP